MGRLSENPATAVAVSGVGTALVLLGVILGKYELTIGTFATVSLYDMKADQKVLNLFRKYL